MIGSQFPWVESLLLAEGARQVTTLEYNPIKSEHPGILTRTPDQMAAQVADHSVLFDGMVTFSSLEHSGLGRYGDQLNPWGDLVTMARAWCVVAPGGRAIVGLPMAGKDLVCMNAHRMYGPVMLGHLFSNWDVVWAEAQDFAKFPTDCNSWMFQPITVLEKPKD